MAGVIPATPATRRAGRRLTVGEPRPYHPRPMTRLRRARWIAWITLAAVLLGLASLGHPGLGRKALPRLLADICITSGSASGAFAAAAGAAPGTPAPDGGSHHDHCWSCGKVDANPALLEARAVLVLPSPAAEPPPLHAPVVAAPAPALLSPPSRAPPRTA
jgi:hypothetical protein